MIFAAQKGKRQRILHEGFTIVELLIVIVVIAILAAITIVAYNGIQQQAIDSAVRADIHSGVTQVELSKVTDGVYPSSAQNLKSSAGNTLQYTSDGVNFCLSVSNERDALYTHHYDSTSRQIENGYCMGHTGVPVTTFAGSGTWGGADGVGVAAQFQSPYGIARSPSGTLYVSEPCRIRTIAVDGTVSTLAGGSVCGYAEGSGAAAQFSSAYGVALDSNGNLYVADRNNNRIRKVTPAGAVTTFAGSGTAGGADGSSTAAQFNNPSGIVIDSANNLYVAEWGGTRIRKVTPSGTVSTLPGTGVAYYSMGGIALDSSGNIYVTDTYRHNIRKLTPAGVVSTLAGNGTSGVADGTGSAAQFNSPSGLVLGGDGSLYVTENYRVRKVTMAGVVTTVAGSAARGFNDGIGASALFDAPRLVTMDTTTNTLYVADTSNNRIRKVVLQ